MTASSTIYATNPRTAERLGSYPSTTPEELQVKIAAAKLAFSSPAFADDRTREGFLRSCATRLRARGSELVPLCESETGLPHARVVGELERMCIQFEGFADLIAAGEYAEPIIDHSNPVAKPAPQPDTRRISIPIGPVAVFGASNFPFGLGAGGVDTAGALAAGCTVVAKGHPSHPGTNEVIATEIRAALLESSLPADAFSPVQGGGIPIGEAMVDHPTIEAVAFTGSFAGGKALFDRANRRPRPIPVFAEMGSVNPVVVTDRALVERSREIMEGLVSSVTFAAGQLCTKPGVALLPSTAAGESFAQELVAVLQQADTGVMLNQRLHDSLVERVDDLAQQTGVQQLTTNRKEQEHGCHYPATVFRTTTKAVSAAPSLLEERFGPVVLLVFYRTEEDLLGTLNLFVGQLAASIHSAHNEEADIQAVVNLLRGKVGRLVFNGFSTGVAFTHAMHHGGPFPAATFSRYTSIGLASIQRFLRPITYQDAPAHLLPPALQDDNPLAIWRRVDGELTR